MEAAQALPAALEALHLRAALVAVRTLEAVLMVHVPLEVVHTLVALTVAWALTLVALTAAWALTLAVPTVLAVPTAQEALTLVEVTSEDVDN